MKWMKQIGAATTLSILTLGVANAKPLVEKSVALEEAMLSVTISDLHGLLNGVGSVAAQVSPMMNGMMLKSMVGMQLGDPGLAGIAPGKGLSIIALDPTNIFAVVEVAAAQITAYTNALAPKGVQFEYANGLLVIGQTEEQVAKGIAFRDAVKSTLLVNPSPTLRIALQPAAIVERNNDQIQGLLQKIPALMGQGMMQAPGATLGSVQNTLRLLEGELRVLLSLAGQCDVAEIVLAPQNGSIRISKTFAPRAGSRLETLCNAPVLNTQNSKIQSGYLGGGALGFDIFLTNPQALMDFMVGEAEQLVKEMEITEIDLAGLVSLQKKWWNVSGGSMSEIVGMDSESGLTMGYLMDVTDEAEALNIVKALPQDLESFLPLYEDLGMSLAPEFKENVREHNGVKIHQFALGMSMTNQSVEVVEQLSAMNLTNMVYEIAINDGVMVLSMGESRIEATLDRLKDETFKPTSLKARSTYPAEGFYYFDLDMGAYMAFVTSFMPNIGNPMLSKKMGDLFQGVEPITSAGFKADGRVMWSINLPGELIAKYGQMAMMMQMQKIQQPQSGVPQALPVE